MDKALEMGKTSATGSFHQLIGVAGSALIMAVGTLVLNGMLPVSGVGLYGMALIPSSIINFFRDWGINYAMTQPFLQEQYSLPPAESSLVLNA